MAVTLRQDQSRFRQGELRERLQRKESFVHFLAREMQWVLRTVVILAAATTVLAMFTIFYWAILPAMILLVSYCLLLMADYIEFRTHQPGDPGWESELPVAEREALAAEAVQAHAAPLDASVQRVDDAVKARLTKTVIGIIVAVATVSIVVAGIFLEVQVLALGGMILFAYWLFIAAPLWLGWLEDEAEDEARRTEDELHGVRS